MKNKGQLRLRPNILLFDFVINFFFFIDFVGSKEIDFDFKERLRLTVGLKYNLNQHIIFIIFDLNENIKGKLYIHISHNNKKKVCWKSSQTFVIFLFFSMEEINCQILSKAINFFNKSQNVGDFTKF